MEELTICVYKYKMTWIQRVFTFFLKEPTEFVFLKFPVSKEVTDTNYILSIKETETPIFRLEKKFMESIQIVHTKKMNITSSQKHDILMWGKKSIKLDDIAFMTWYLFFNIIQLRDKSFCETKEHSTKSLIKLITKKINDTEGSCNGCG